MIVSVNRRHRRSLSLHGFLAVIVCYHAIHTAAWNTCSNSHKLPFQFQSTPQLQLQPQLRPLYCPLPSISTRSTSPAKRRRSSLASASAPDNGNKELPTSAAQPSETKNRNKAGNKNTNKRRNKKGNTKRKGGNKNKTNRNKNQNKNNNARRKQTNGGNNNNNNNKRNGNHNNNANRPNNTKSKSVTATRSAASAKTVSELVQNVRRILSAQPPQNEWRSAWSILRSEATIPAATKDDQEQPTVLPVRVYHDVLESMKRERRCWQDAIRLVNYMEQGSDKVTTTATTTEPSSTTTTSNRATDDYNRRPWHIPSPNYEIYHTLIECIRNNGGGRKDAHDASVYWLSKMLRKLESDLQQEQEQPKEVEVESKGFVATITNRDRKLVRNSIQLVLSSLSKQGRWRDALQLLEYTEILSLPDRAKIPLTVVQYNTVLTCLARSKQVGQCQRLLQRLQDRSRSNQNNNNDSSPISPDEISYNAVIGACASIGKWREALAVLDECYKEPDFEPNIYIFTNAMRACAKGGNIPKALSLLQVVKDKGLPVDSYCYTAVIDGMYCMHRFGIFEIQ